jgi:hypothetical protein
MPLKVKWLLEPRDIHPENFTPAALKGFDVIYTHDPYLLDHDLRARLFYLGGTRVHESEWGGNTATFAAPVSVVASHKRGLPGHALRHELIAACPSLAAFGLDYGGEVEKADVLHGSLFHVAIESVRSPCLFTEHLLDAMLTMNVPIYWGADETVLKSAGFDLDGILFADSQIMLQNLVGRLATEPERRREYMLRREALLHNFHIAHAYTCPEDWLWRQDSSLFDE